MKKLILLSITLLMMSACTTVEEPELRMKIIDLTVKSTDWKAQVDNNGQNLYYSASFTMPEITSYIFQNGDVRCNLLAAGAQSPLPSVRHYQNLSGNSWTRTIDYDYTAGDLKIYVTNSDFYPEIPETMNFRVVLTW
ncbi:MAG: hypothetical protein RIS29_3363 [Bacteroidota bacterium]|jgi:hypothetical protein